jgi:hypothetical protein
LRERFAARNTGKIFDKSDTGIEFLLATEGLRRGTRVK